MKKIASLALAALIVTALGVGASASSTFEAASGTPVIDGKKDAAYACAGVAVNLLNDGSTVSSGATGEAYFAWDKDYFYVFVDVTDSAVTKASDVTSIWQNDCIEFYINLEGADGAIADINAAQYTYGPSFTAFVGGGKHRENNVDNAKSAYTYTDKGWTVEIAIPWGSDYKPEAGATITGAVAINDDNDGDPSTRDQQVFTGANQNGAWQTADSNWDNIKLTETKAAVATDDGASATTADIGVVSALAALAASGAAVLSLKKRRK